MTTPYIVYAVRMSITTPAAPGELRAMLQDVLIYVETELSASISFIVIDVERVKPNHLFQHDKPQETPTKKPQKKVGPTKKKPVGPSRHK